MKTLFLIFTALTLQLAQCQSNTTTSSSETSINTTLEKWHKAAANADFDSYFGLMTQDSYFLGTDATENWSYKDFKAFSKPYFDKGKAWSFTTLERNIFVKEGEDIAWFDEHLDTQMGICRGSGVMKKINKDWKIAHYVLSIAVPNDNVLELTALKKEWDSIQMITMRKHHKF